MESSNNNIKKIGCLFGSFNPIHYGHINMAIQSLNIVDEVWIILSPQNPFKVGNFLEDVNHRLNMINLSLEEYGDNRIKSCDIEIGMDTPSYTYKTLRILSERYPDYEFYIITGSDTINKMKFWKNYDEVSKYHIISFIRGSENVEVDNTKNVTILESDSNLSSTIIREKLKNNQDINGLLPDKIIKYINSNKIFKL